MNDVVMHALFGEHECRPVVRSPVQVRIFNTAEIAAFCGIGPKTFLRFLRVGKIDVESKRVGTQMEYTLDAAQQARAQVRKLSDRRYVA